MPANYNPFSSFLLIFGHDNFNCQLNANFTALFIKEQGTENLRLYTDTDIHLY